MSPYQVVFGRQPRMPLELELGVSINSPATVSEYVQSVRNTLRDIKKIAEENLNQVRANQMERSINSRKGWNPYTTW